jgi:hypothetical protein
LWDRIGSGSSKLGGHRSSPRPLKGSGEAWTEELVVRMVASGDMMGEPCCELEAMEEELTAEAGMAMGCCELKFVITWLGRDRRS